MIKFRIEGEIYRSCDVVEAETRKSQASFQVIQVSFEALLSSFSYAQISENTKFS